MAAKTKQTGLEFDQTEWRKENGIDYATYTDEKEYISPEKINKQSLTKLRELRRKLETTSISR